MREVCAGGSRGSSLMEMVVVLAILALLAAIATPYARKSIQREKEIQLRETLRTVRMAIDRFHADWERKKSHGGKAAPAPASALASPPSPTAFAPSVSASVPAEAAAASPRTASASAPFPPASLEGYPLSLQSLIPQIEKPNRLDMGVEEPGEKREPKHYLRSLPLNPFAPAGTPFEEQWTFVSSQRPIQQITTSSYGTTLAEAQRKEENDIYDLHARTPLAALDGTRYSDW